MRCLQYFPLSLAETPNKFSVHQLARCWPTNFSAQQCVCDAKIGLTVLIGLSGLTGLNGIIGLVELIGLI